MNKALKVAINLPFIIILGAAAVIGNMVALRYEPQINSLLCPPVTSDDQTISIAREKGQALSKQIVEEGSVLVKNDNNTLPLDKVKDNKVNIFGWGSTNWVVSGGGSGMVRPENGNTDENITLLKAIANYGYGINYNRELTDMYTRFKKADDNNGGSFPSAGYNSSEPNINDKNWYTDELLKNAKEYSNTAIVVLSRFSAESSSEKTISYLTINDNERALLEYVGKNYEKVIILINSCNTMNLAFLDEIEGLDSCLVIGPTGTRGAAGIPSILYGDVSPSGRLVDTYVYDFNSNINIQYIGLGSYDEVSKYVNPVDSNSDAYEDYIEGIYVGYKWYETADEEGIWDNIDNQYGKGYEGVVQYPFGYGLSYTDFEWSIEDIKVMEDGKEVESTNINEKSSVQVSIRVKNSGDVAGKDVVELYMKAPYYEGGIEKSSIQLIDFAKTNTIEPNKEEIVTLSFDAYDMLSYDCYDLNKNGNTGYELDDGTYKFQLMENVHQVKQVINSNNEHEDGVFELNVASNSEDKAYIFKTDKYTGVEVNNLFTGEDAVDGYSLDGSTSEGEIPFISRTNFPDPFTYKKPAARTMNEELAKNAYLTEEYVNDWDNAKVDVFNNPTHQEKVTWGKDNGLRVYEDGLINELGLKLGADYDDPLWDDVLDQVAFKEAYDLIGNSYGTKAISSIGKPYFNEYDGPSQIKGYTDALPRGTGYPSATTLAQSWSKQLAYSFGLSYGMDCQSLSVAGVWGFGTNIHRTPFGARNFEYYSEDAILSGEILLNSVKGLQNAGIYPYLKHFVLNETESHRNYLFNWCTEQALREIYLKPFQMAVQEADCQGIMTTYGRIGGVYTGGSQALNTGVVRGEWGFRGAIITDYAYDLKFMNQDHALRAGGDLGMGVPLNNNKNGFNIIYDENNSSNRLQYQMREAVHHVVYSGLRVRYINSNYNASADTESQIIPSAIIDSWNWWKPLMYGLDFFVATMLFVWLIALFIDDKKKNDVNENAIY